jgi:hypothetical protein
MKVPLKEGVDPCEPKDLLPKKELTRRVSGKLVRWFEFRMANLKKGEPMDQANSLSETTAAYKRWAFHSDCQILAPTTCYYASQRNRRQCHA